MSSSSANPLAASTATRRALRWLTLPAGLALVFACSRGDQGQLGGADDPDTAVGAPTATQTRFELADFLKPRMGLEHELDPYLAPLLYLEALPDGSPAPPGAAGLDAQGRLTVDVTRPVVYWEERQEQLGERTYRQTAFLWFRTLPSPAGPSPQGVRVTYDSRGFPVVFEVLADSSGARVLYVAESLERLAADTFGGALDGKRHAVESASPIVLAGIISNGSMPMGPYVYLANDASDVVDLHCRCSPTQTDEIRDAIEYELVPLELLEGVWPNEAGGALSFAPARSLERLLRLPREL